MLRLVKLFEFPCSYAGGLCRLELECYKTGLRAVVRWISSNFDSVLLSFETKLAMSRHLLAAGLLIAGSSASPITNSTTNGTSVYSFDDVRNKIFHFNIR